MSDGFRNITRKQFLQMSLGAAGAGAAMSFGFPGMAAAQSAQRTRPIPKSGEALPTVGLGT
ncbi:MAG: hypothetical protein QGF09_05370, partial [Rhodospirillales bacterium]|nr:hypothetical protein [Rhodospirillales bacterium]